MKNKMYGIQKGHLVSFLLLLALAAHGIPLHVLELFPSLPTASGSHGRFTSAQKKKKNRISLQREHSVFLDIF